MNLTEGYEVRTPVRYVKTCRYCGAVLKVERKDMNFSGPTFAKCECGHEVQFTDDIGRCPCDVGFEFGEEMI